MDEEPRFYLMNLDSARDEIREGEIILDARGFMPYISCISKREIV